MCCVFVLSLSCAPYVASFSGLSILECLCGILERLFTCRCFLTNHGYVTFLICHLLFFKLEFHNSHYCTIYFDIYILHFVLSDKRYNWNIIESGVKPHTCVASYESCIFKQRIISCNIDRMTNVNYSICIAIVILHSPDNIKYRNKQLFAISSSSSCLKLIVFRV